jgi:hypothetical protein
MRGRRGKRSTDAAFKVCEGVTEHRILRVPENLSARRYIEKRSVGIFNHERGFSA